MRFHGIDLFSDIKETLPDVTVNDYKTHFCVTISKVNFFFSNKQQAQDVVNLINSKIKEIEEKMEENKEATQAPVPDELENLPDDVKEEDFDLADKIDDNEEGDDNEEDFAVQEDEDELEDEDDETEGEVTGNTDSESK